MTVYGAALNDREQLRLLAAEFEHAPYQRPPERPVLYIKPRNCLMGDGGIVGVPPDLQQIEVATTLALLIGRDACRVTRAKALDHVSGICLALDASEPYDNYFRPPVRQRCRDGFLRLGALVAFAPGVMDNPIETFVGGKVVHSWSPRRLHRDAAALISDISQFMTLAAGDLLLVGLPHDAPRLAAGCDVTACCGSLLPLHARLVGTS